MAENITIDQLEIKIGVESARASSKVKKLASSLREAAPKADQAKKSLSAVSKEVKDLETTASSSEKTTEELGESVSSLGDSAKTATPKLRAVTKHLKDTSTQAKATSADVAQASSTTAKSTEKVSKASQKAHATANKSNKQTHRSLREFAKSVDTSNSKLLNLWNTFKRIAMYRAMRSAIRAIVSAISEGFKMFVDWDREQNGGLAGAAKAVDELKEKWFELKGALGAAIAPLVQTALPVIKLICDALIGLINIFQQVIRALRGEDYWYRAVYKDVKATTGAAKELQRVLFGFDELNVLPSANGGGASLDSGYVDFVREEIPAWLKVVAPIGATLLTIYGTIKSIKRILESLKKPVDLAATAATTLLDTFGLVQSILEFIFSLLSGFDRTVKVRTDLKELKNLKSELEDTKRKTEEYAKYFKDNPLKINAIIPTLDFKPMKESLLEMNKWLSDNKLNVVLKMPEVDSSLIEKGIEDINKWLKNNPLVVALDADIEEFGDNIKDAIDEIRKAFGRNRLSLYFGFDLEVINESIRDVLKYIQSVFNNSPIKIKAELDLDKSTPAPTTSFDWSNDNSLGKKIGGGFSSGNLTGKDDRTVVQKALDWVYENVNQKIFGYATGGTVPYNTGTLFYSGEAGAEVVANMGHSTGVMNMSQMQEAVANGNIEVVNAVYAMANMVAGAVNNKNFDVYMDSSKVGQSVSKYQFNQARRGVPQGAI